MNRTAFGILSILLNSIGITSFVNGYTKTGILRIVLSLFVLPGVPVCSIIFLICGIIDGIKILKMTDEEFEAQKSNFGAKLFGTH